MTDRERLKAAMEFVLKTFDRLGLVVNTEKSLLNPSQRIEWWGAVWDTNTRSVALTQSDSWN